MVGGWEGLVGWVLREDQVKWEGSAGLARGDVGVALGGRLAAHVLEPGEGAGGDGGVVTEGPSEAVEERKKEVIVFCSSFTVA